MEMERVTDRRVLMSDVRLRLPPPGICPSLLLLSIFLNFEIS